MTAEEIRSAQAPLRDAYRAGPEAARTALHATATLDGPGVTVDVPGWAGTARAGLHPATGGDGSDACSGDMLLQALVACAGVTLRSVALAQGVEWRSARAEAAGVFDARGTLGMSREVPVGLFDITVTFELDTDADDRALQRLAQSAERYCVVGQSLTPPPTIVVRRARTDSATT